MSTTESKDDSKSIADNIRSIEASSILQVATTVQQEEEELRSLKGMLDTQGTLRPIFDSALFGGTLLRRKSVKLHALGEKWRQVSHFGSKCLKA